MEMSVGLASEGPFSIITPIRLPSVALGAMNQSTCMHMCSHASANRFLRLFSSLLRLRRSQALSLSGYSQFHYVCKPLCVQSFHVIISCVKAPFSPMYGEISWLWGRSAFQVSHTEDVRHKWHSCSNFTKLLFASTNGKNANYFIATVLRFRDVVLSSWNSFIFPNWN